MFALNVTSTGKYMWITIQSFLSHLRPACHIGTSAIVSPWFAAVARNRGIIVILSQVSTEAERDSFLRSVRKATQQNSTVEITLSPGPSAADLDLYYGRAYSLCDDAPEGENIPIAGLAFHSLNQFAQSYAAPHLDNLSHNIIEIGRLWCITRHKLRPLLKGLLILAGLYQCDALLIYPVIAPQSYTAELAPFRCVTQPIAADRENTPRWVQGMLLQGEDLRVATRQAMNRGFEVRSGFQSIHFTEADDTDVKVRDQIGRIAPAPVRGRRAN